MANEEAIIAAKGAGDMARTQAEFARHPQGAAVAVLPLMEIITQITASLSRLREPRSLPAGLPGKTKNEVGLGARAAMLRARSGASILHCDHGGMRPVNDYAKKAPVADASDVPSTKCNEFNARSSLKWSVL